MARFADPAPLKPGHDIGEFDCGTASLNTWLRRHARQAAPSRAARVFVVEDAEQERVVGYYALAAASIPHSEATDRTAKGMPKHPIPAALLARLAVDKTVQGQGLGAWLLRDAMQRTVAAAQSVGIRVMLVHAVDAAARAFYTRHDFEPSPIDGLNLQMLIKDIRASIDAAG